MDRNTISLPIEQGLTNGVGEPWSITRHGKPLNDRQQALLDQLPEYDSRATVDKDDVSMMDLAALTAKTKVEFAMFTQGSRRLIVRGDAAHVNITPSDAAKMNAQGYKWSGHTHVDGLIASSGDKAVLKMFHQNESVIYDVMGKHITFNKF